MDQAETIELAARNPPSGSISEFNPTSTTQADTDGTVLENEASIHRNESSLAPVDKGYGAWSFLVAAFFVEAVTWSFPETFGIFLEAYLNDPHYALQPHAATLLPLTGTISSGITYCSSPVVYAIVARYPQHRRTLAWIGACICCSSLLGASYASKVVELLLIEGILYGIGGTLLYAPCMLYMNEWFVQRRGLATSIIFAGSSVGGVALPLILPRVISTHGTSKTLLYLSICYTALLLPLLPFFKGRLSVSRLRAHGPTPRSNRNLMQNRSFWLLISLNVVHSFGFFLPFIWLPTFASDLNLNSANSALTIVLLNGCSLIGGLVTGHLSDKFNPWLIALFTCALTTVAIFVLWGILAHSFVGLLSFGIAYGLLGCTWAQLWASLVSPIANNEPSLSTSIFGYLMFTRGIGNILSAPISSRLSSNSFEGNSTTPGALWGHERTGFEVGGGRFEKMIVYVGSIFAGAAGIALLGWGLDVKNRASRVSNANHRG